MINYDNYATFDIPADDVDEIKDIGYRIQTLEYKIYDIRRKIEEKYFT